MVPILRTPLHQIRQLLQNTRRLLRSVDPPAEKNTAQRYARVHHAQSRRNQNQPHQVQHGHQRSKVRICQPGLIPA